MSRKSELIPQKIKQLLKVKEYQYVVFVILLLFMSFQINRQINNTNKLICLLLGLVICIYQPVMLIPFLIFLITIYYLYKNKKKSKNVIEPFELGVDCVDPYVKEGVNVADVNKTVINALEKGEMECKYKSVIHPHHINHKTFMKSIEENNKKDIENKLYFYRNFFNIYFFDENKEEDWKVINYILNKTSNFDDLIDVIDVTDSSGIFIEALDKELLTKLEKNYKKLGMFFYQNKDTNYMINNQIMDLLKNMGLYPIYMNNYIDNDLLEKQLYKDIKEIKKQDKKLRREYEKIKKHIYELGILHYKAIRDIDKEYYFKNVENLELDFEPYHIYDKTFIKNKNFISRYEKINEYFLLREVKIEKEKISNLVSEEDSIKLFNLYNITKENLNNAKDLENKVFKPLSDFIKDNIDRLNLLEENYYKISPNREIAYNYLTLLFIFNGKVVKDDKTIKFTDYLGEGLEKGFIIDLHKNKKDIFEKQIIGEKLSGLYTITSEDDLLIDNILYYYQLYHTDYEVEKIYPIDYHIKEKKEEKKEEKIEGITSKTDQQQYNYQLQLDSDFDNKLLEDKKKQQLEKYYELLDKEKYDSIDSLNKLAESRNKELAIENQSFTKKVDDFSTTLYALIDEITDLIKKAYNDNLGKDLTLYQKYILFFEKLLNILIKEDRALHTGFLMIIIALLLYFLDNKSNTVSCGCNNNSGLSNILQLIKTK
jgi:hypothetical protein